MFLPRMSTVLEDVVYTSVIKIVIYLIFSVPRSSFLDENDTYFPFDIFLPPCNRNRFFFLAISTLSTYC